MLAARWTRGPSEYLRMTARDACLNPMTTLRLILRNLTHFRAASIAVVAGMTVATAVLAGSLMVGDSVRGSLKQLAVDRLGPVDYALVTNQFFDDSTKSSLAARVASAPGVN